MVGEQVAGDPQNLHSSLSLQLESQICYLIQVPVGLLQGGAFRGHISGKRKSRFMDIITPQFLDGEIRLLFDDSPVVERVVFHLWKQSKCWLKWKYKRLSWLLRSLRDKGDWTHAQFGEELKRSSQPPLGCFQGSSFIPGPAERREPERIRA